MIGEPLVVTRVQDDTGSHIEPPLDQEANDLTKLRWHAAVVFEDTGVRVNVSPSDRDTYCLFGRGWGISAMSFGACWIYLNGVQSGAEMAREAALPHPDTDPDG